MDQAVHAIMTMDQDLMDRGTGHPMGMEEVAMGVTKCKVVTSREDMDSQDKPLQVSTELSQAMPTDPTAITTMVQGADMEVTNSPVCQ